MKSLFSSCIKISKSLLCVFISLALLLQIFPAVPVNAASKQASFSDDISTITVKEVSAWDKSLQIEVIIHNDSSSSIINWKLEFELQGTITSIWNAKDVSADGKCLIEAESFNSEIPAGEEISFGFIAEGAKKNPGLPTEVILIRESLQEEEPETTFDYALFSVSDTENFSLRCSKSIFSGDVYSGKDFEFSGSELYIDGAVKTVGKINASGWKVEILKRLENVTPKEIPDWRDPILEKVENCETFEGDVSYVESKNIINGWIQVDGDVTINGSSFEGDCFIVATGNITYNVAELNGSGRVLLYSETGSITINGAEINVNGIMYAPNGAVVINAYNTTINGRVVSDSIRFADRTSM